MGRYKEWMSKRSSTPAKNQLLETGNWDQIKLSSSLSPPICGTITVYIRPGPALFTSSKRMLWHILECAKTKQISSIPIGRAKSYWSLTELQVLFGINGV